MYIDTQIPTTLLLVNFPVSKSISYLSFFFFYGIPTCKTPKAAPKNTHLLTKKKHVKNYVPLNLSRLQIFENFFYISEFLMYVCVNIIMLLFLMYFVQFSWNYVYLLSYHYYSPKKDFKFFEYLCNLQNQCKVYTKEV